MNPILRKLLDDLNTYLRNCESAGVTAVVVFKPGVNESTDDGSDYAWPDVILTNAKSPQTIAALLGNFEEEEENND